MATNPDINNTTIAKRVEQYIKLRDLIKQLDDEHKKKMSPYRETLEQLNNVMLDHLNQLNVESAKTAVGTVYRTEKKSAAIADMTAFWSFVTASEQWDLLDRKANVTAVSDYLDEHGSLPPGVNFHKSYVVGVRRA